jgi:hypothetical protein
MKDKPKQRSKIKYSFTAYFKNPIVDILLTLKDFKTNASYVEQAQHYYLSVEVINELTENNKNTLIQLLEPLKYRMHDQFIYVAYTSNYDTGNIFIPEIVTEISHKLNARIWVSVIFG